MPKYQILRKLFVTFAVILADGRARPLHAKNAQRFENTQPKDYEEIVRIFRQHLPLSVWY